MPLPFHTLTSKVMVLGYMGFSIIEFAHLLLLQQHIVEKWFFVVMIRFLIHLIQYPLWSQLAQASLDSLEHLISHFNLLSFANIGQALCAKHQSQNFLKARCVFLQQNYIAIPMVLIPFPDDWFCMQVFLG